MGCHKDGRKMEKGEIPRQVELHMMERVLCTRNGGRVVYPLK